LAADFCLQRRSLLQSLGDAAGKTAAAKQQTPAAKEQKSAKKESE
jgi:hypothetical protein